MRRLRVYLAASYARREEMFVFSLLFPNKIQLTASWVEASPEDSKCSPEQLQAWAEVDAEEIKQAHVVVVFLEDGPVRGGHLVEMGIAIGANVTVLAVGKDRTVFDHHPMVRRVRNKTEAIAWLTVMTDVLTDRERKLL